MISTKKEVSISNEQYALVLHTIFSDASFVTQLLQFLAQDHKFKSSEGTQDRYAGIPQFLQSDPRIAVFRNFYTYLTIL